MCKKTLLCAFLCVSVSYALQAQAFQNAGSTGAQFLNIGVGARAMGMGGAFASVLGDATALAWNPAGIGMLDAIQVSAQHTSWTADIDHNFIGVVVPLTRRVNLAFHTIYLTSGDIEITTIDLPEGTGKFYNAASVAAGLSTSVRLTSQLVFATTVKYIEERIYDVSGGTVAADAGAWYDTGYRSLRLGFSVVNLGFEHGFSGRSLQVRYDPPGVAEPLARAELETLSNSLPLLFRASGSLDLFEMFGRQLNNHRMILAMDFMQHSDTPERVAAGVEYTWRNTFSLRSGYLFNADELSWSAGGGVRLQLSDFSFDVDYAASSLGRFGLAHRFGVSLSYD